VTDKPHAPLIVEDQYGRSPMMDFLPTWRAYNALPPEERARANAQYVNDMIERGEWGND
jgi:hypothetical protein